LCNFLEFDLPFDLLERAIAAIISVCNAKV
jgi:hypothetical protein